MTPPEIIALSLSLSPHAEHGEHAADHRLHGTLTLPDTDKLRGLVVFVSACGGDDPPGEAEMKEALLAENFATVQMPLLREAERHFADATTHLPRLAERLLALLGLLRQQMNNQAIPEVGIGLVAAGDMSPLALRVAAIRDEDVKALVCHGGLLDLAGVQYLKVLRAPLLMLVDPDDTPASANARRAAGLIPAITEIVQLLPVQDRKQTVPRCQLKHL